MKKVLSSVGVIGLCLSASMVWSQDDLQGILDRHCLACHNAGLAGAPKMDDAAAWSPRLEKDLDALTQTVISGKGAMPPKGTCFSCSDGTLKAAVELMIQPFK